MSENLAVITETVRKGDREIVALQSGTALWQVVRALGDQIVESLKGLGYVRVDELGRQHSFQVSRLAVSPDGRLAAVHLDTSARMFEPMAQKARHRGKVVPYTRLTSEDVIDQLRVDVSRLLGYSVDLWADNHFYVRYGIAFDDLGDRKGVSFPAGNLTDHLDDAPGPFTIPLGLGQDGELVWLDLAKDSRHVLLAGSTGAGKTTYLDTCVCTLTQHTSPDQLRMMFLDPQRGINFGPYRSLTDYHFEDKGETLGVVTDAAGIVAAVARLHAEYLRRTEMIAGVLWSNLEEYNRHVDPQDRLPYIFLFSDELDNLAIELEKLGTKQVKAFMRNLRGLVSGARKVGIRVFLCLQYLHKDTISPAIASQAALSLVFWSSRQGSKNVLGNESAHKLPGAGRFIVEGLPGGNRTLQGLFVDRETVLELMDTETTPHAARPVDEVVMDVVKYALSEMEGGLSRNRLEKRFGDLLSGRQVGNLVAALEQIGLALPADRSSVPPQPRRLKVESAEEAERILRGYPRVCFREDGGRLLFGPSAA